MSASDQPQGAGPVPRRHRLEPGGRVTVTLVKHDRADIRYPAEAVHDDGLHVVVRATWSGAPSLDLGFARFEEGDVFTEHYWRDRWYSIKEVRAAEGGLKGWYCDVCRPVRVGPAALISEDLYLDLWLSGDRGALRRLDEEEFEASGLARDDPAAARHAREALDTLERLARADAFASALHTGP